jgi:hypothetical protein
MNFTKTKNNELNPKLNADVEGGSEFGARFMEGVF